MEDLLRPRRPSAISRWRVLAVVGLTVALLVDILATYLAVAAVFSLINASLPTFFLAAPIVLFGLSIAALFVGAGRVAARLPAGPKPFLRVPAAAAAAFLFASALDIVLFGTAGGIDTVYPASYATKVRILLALAWFVTGAVWATACVVSEVRRRAGSPYRALVIIAGFVMAAVQVAGWLFVGLTPTPIGS